MAKISSKQYYILLKNCEAIEHKHKIVVGKFEIKTNVLAGSLWQSERLIMEEDMLEISSAESGLNLNLQINKKHLGSLTLIYFKLLLALTTCSDRLLVFTTQFKNLKMTEYIRKLSKHVYSIPIPIIIHENSLKKFDGQLRFIGCYPQRVGLWLGINLNQPYVGKVFDTNSVFNNGEPLFPHTKNCAFFANIAQISYPINIENYLQEAMHEFIKYNIEDSCGDSILNCLIINKPYLLNRYKKENEKFALIDEKNINRTYHTVPSIKIQSQMSNIKDESFWKYQENKLEDNNLNILNESNHQLTVPSIKKYPAIIEMQDIFGKEQKAWSSANDIKNSNDQIDVISRAIPSINLSELDKFKNNKDRKIDYNNKKEHKSQTSSSNSTYSTSSTDNINIGDPMLTIGERVIWFTEEGKSELATVKWIGILDKLPTQYTVGVEFDNPIGTGTGRYANKNLFFARNNHASLIPIMGLVKANDVQSNDPSKNSFLPNPEFQSTMKMKICPRSNSLMTIPSYSSTKQNFNYVKKQLSAHNLYTDTPTTPTNLNMDSFEMLDMSKENLTIENIEYELNMLVEVKKSQKIVYGVIRWIGEINEKNMLGIELEADCDNCTDGIYNCIKYFDCPVKRGIFAKPSSVQKDSRFQEPDYLLNRTSSQLFGNLDCVELTDNHNHLMCENMEELKQLLDDFSSKHKFKAVDNSLGINLGIQGHDNSCYIDTILFSMFSFCASFDFLLHRPPQTSDINKYTQVQTILRNSIVNPLRCNLYVKANMVLLLRKIISEISSNTIFLGKEADPEELLNVLLIDIFKIKPFLKFSSGYLGLFYQLIVEKPDYVLPTTQQLLEMSLQQSQVIFREVPSILMLQMPRFGLSFKVCHRILPSLTIHLQDLLEQDNSECSIDGTESQQQCSKCAAYFYTKNNNTIHEHICEDCKEHCAQLKSNCENLHLFAVICINTSHYVCYVRCGESEKAPWVFFDSMADRIGSSHGYNMPQVKPCQYIPECLLPNYVPTQFSLSDSDDTQLPEELRRLLCDGYICMYRCTNLQPYR